MSVWDEWPRLWPLLEPAYRQSDDQSDVLAGIVRGDFQLWRVGAINHPLGVIVTRLWRNTTSAESRCHVWLVGGSRMSEWAGDFIEALKGWARSEGCSAITGNGRIGWDRIVRRLGFERVADRDGLPCCRMDL